MKRFWALTVAAGLLLAAVGQTVVAAPEPVRDTAGISLKISCGR